MHDVCSMIHTDLKPENIMIQLKKESLVIFFVKYLLGRIHRGSKKVQKKTYKHEIFGDIVTEEQWKK